MGTGVNGGSVPLTFPVQFRSASGQRQQHHQRPARGDRDRWHSARPPRRSRSRQRSRRRRHRPRVRPRHLEPPHRRSGERLLPAERRTDGRGLERLADPLPARRASDTATTQRTVGAYVTFEPANVPGFIGIRRYPYTTDNDGQPADLRRLSPIPRTPSRTASATIWATMLWEMYWNIVGIDGYDPDVYFGTGGNNVAYQLVIDGMKLQPCAPGFVDGTERHPRRRRRRLRRRPHLRNLESVRRARARFLGAQGSSAFSNDARRRSISPRPASTSSSLELRARRRRTGT